MSNVPAAPQPTQLPTLPVQKIHPTPTATPTSQGPKTLQIPDLNVTMPITPVGVTANNAMEIPENPDVAGWYKYGASPLDQAGATVISAHVDSKKLGVGPLAKLKNLTPGNTVTVTWGSTTHTYKVSTIQNYQKTALPIAELFRRDGAPGLTLITCGGTFNPKKGHYDENLVVTAELL